MERKSGDEHFVEFFDNGLQGILAEDAVGNSQRYALIGIDALPGVEVGVLILRGKRPVKGDVVFDDLEPVALDGVASNPWTGVSHVFRRGFDVDLEAETHASLRVRAARWRIRHIRIEPFRSKGRQGNALRHVH